MKIEEQVLSIEQARHLQELGLNMSDAALCLVSKSYVQKQDTWGCIYNEDIPLNERKWNVTINDFMDNIRGYEYTPVYTLQEMLHKLPPSIQANGESFDLIYQTGECAGYATPGYHYGWDDQPYGTLDFFICFNSGNGIQDVYDLVCWAISYEYLKIK